MRSFGRRSSRSPTAVAPTILGAASHDRAVWLIPLLLVLVVLAPTATLLWLINEAARSESEAARQRVTDAYRGELRFIRDRIDAFWDTRAAAL